MELLEHPVRRRVVDHARPEHRDHELRGIALAELRVGCAKERLVARRSRQQDHPLRTEPEGRDPVAIAVGPLQECDGVAKKRA